MPDRERCQECGTPLSTDNTTGTCGPCESARPHQSEQPPDVPPGFWETDYMQAALRTQHMGKIVRAYRLHRYHGRPIPQETAGRWVYRGQGAISRLELGPPPANLQELRNWANLLGIPERYLWFTLSDDSSYRPTALDSLTVLEAKRQAQQLADLLDEIVGAERQPAASTPSGGDALPPPSAARSPVLTGPLAGPPINIDIDQAQGSRMGDYLLGGRANFRVDREAIDLITSALPGGAETAKAVTHASQDFQRRALHWLVSEAGIRQFFLLGARLPKHLRPHELIYDAAPDAQVLYVVEDDTVLAHVRELQQGSSADATRWIRANLYDVPDLLAQAATQLDFAAPVALFTGGSLRSFNHDDARDVIGRLVEAMASGSYLVTAHLTGDTLGAEMAEVIYRFKALVDEGKMPHLALRSRDEIAQLVGGLELVEPGIVPIDQWRPEQLPGRHTFIYAAVARKP